MISRVCVTLVGCNSGEIRHVPGGIAGDATSALWLSYLGNVVGVTTTEGYSVTPSSQIFTFNDPYYTVQAVFDQICNPEDPDFEDCAECNSNLLIIRRTPSTQSNNPDVFITYINPTGEQECPVPSAYVLQNCGVTVTFENPADIDPSPTGALVTQTDLAFYVGSVIRIEEYPDYCYTVLGPYTQDTGCPCPEFTVLGGYKDCECCLPDIPPKFVRSIPDPVKQFYYIPNSECDIRINKKFAENYYKLFKTIAYGMGPCCDHIDLDKLWIDMELNDYSKISDPNACVTPTTPEEVVCPPTTTTTCQIPTAVTAEGLFD